ncbi:MAG: hypothetical protein MK105_13630 [Crocinitomicaceae bacterium]|nr:hypothetical protein [Crocinitomicaceae bacterium]
MKNKTYFLFVITIWSVQSCRYRNLVICDDFESEYSMGKTKTIVKNKLDSIYTRLEDTSKRIKKIESVNCPNDSIIEVNVLREDKIIDVHRFDKKLRIYETEHLLPPVY